MTSVLWVKRAAEGKGEEPPPFNDPLRPAGFARALTRRAVCSFYGTAENGSGRVSVPLFRLCVRKTRGIPSTLTFVYLAAGTCAPAI